MTRPYLLRLGGAALAVGVVLTIGLWRMAEARADADHDGGPAPAAAAPRAEASQPGLVVLDRDAQVRAGIEVAPLKAAVVQGRARAYAAVLDPARLTGLADGYAGARAQLDAAVAKAQASRKAYERARLLYKDDQNTSLAQLQADEATAHADAAAVVAARAQATTARAGAVQELGLALARDLDGRAVRSIIQRRSFLIQITPAAGEGAASAPAEAVIEAPNGREVAVRLVGAAPHVDPKLQALSFYYLAPAAPGLLPGMNLAAWMPTGGARAGAAVPPSAIVSWQGRSWAYVQAGPGRFRRVSLGDEPPQADGLVTDALQPEALVVTRGAELLLSQELKPQGQAQADED